MQFAEGTQVTYKDISGYVSFVCDSSLCICVKKGLHPSQDVNVVVCRSQYHMIKLYKESDK
jgi:hypothetical protein